MLLSRYYNNISTHARTRAHTHTIKNSILDDITIELEGTYPSKSAIVGLLVHPPSVEGKLLVCFFPVWISGGVAWLRLPKHVR